MSSSLSCWVVSRNSIGNHYLHMHSFRNADVNVACTIRPSTVLQGIACCTTEHTWLVHNDVIKWKHFPHYWPFVREIHRSPVKSPHKGQWRGAFMFYLMACDLRRHRAHYEVIIMLTNMSCGAESGISKAAVAMSPFVTRSSRTLVLTAQNKQRLTSTKMFPNVYILNWTDCNKIRWSMMEIHTFSFQKIYLKTSSGKWHPQYLNHCSYWYIFISFSRAGARILGNVEKAACFKRHQRCSSGMHAGWYRILRMGQETFFPTLYKMPILVKWCRPIYCCIVGLYRRHLWLDHMYPCAYIYTAECMPITGEFVFVDLWILL